MKDVSGGAVVGGKSAGLKMAEENAAAIGEHLLWKKDRSAAAGASAWSFMR